MKAIKNSHMFQKDISGCGLFGVIATDGELINGEIMIKAMHLMRDRGNGLGTGFAAYGIYPEYRDHYAFHVMCDTDSSLRELELYLKKRFSIAGSGEIPIAKTEAVKDPPILVRYFVLPLEEEKYKEDDELSDNDYTMRAVMEINEKIDGAYVFSSGKNMGVFKGVGFSKDIAEFYMIDHYSSYIWTGHNRFPTNTPGWWGGAHPFSLLDYTVVHNGEISSYGINKRYLEMFGYKLTLLTDTEVIAYILDLLIRRHELSINVAARIVAPPFWNDIERLDVEDAKVITAMRQVYAGAILNGPFAFLYAHNRGLVGINDRTKLRPLVIGSKDNRVYMSSEESAIKLVDKNVEEIWAPIAGEAVIIGLKNYI